jgi:hypothetical protein
VPDADLIISVLLAVNLHPDTISTALAAAEQGVVHPMPGALIHQPGTVLAAPVPGAAAAAAGPKSEPGIKAEGGGPGYHMLMAGLAQLGPAQPLHVVQGAQARAACQDGWAVKSLVVLPAGGDAGQQQQQQQQHYMQQAQPLAGMKRRGPEEDNGEGEGQMGGAAGGQDLYRLRAKQRLRHGADG